MNIGDAIAHGKGLVTHPAEIEALRLAYAEHSGELIELPDDFWQRPLAERWELLGLEFHAEAHGTVTPPTRED